MKVLMHYNPGRVQQTRHAEAFKKIGIAITTNVQADADVHIVSGPHYALKFWRRHPRLLWVDRAWWGDPDCVSIGWIRKDGTRKFAIGTEFRPHPEPKRWQKLERSVLVLADYKQDVTALAKLAAKRFGRVLVRRHPSDEKSFMTMETNLGLVDAAIGTSSTAVFEPLIRGVPTICLDPNNPCASVCADSLDAPLIRPDRRQWLHEMSYKQFRIKEFGLAWEMLREIQD